MTEPDYSDDKGKTTMIGKNVHEKSRECHSHNPQPTLTPKERKTKKKQTKKKTCNITYTNVRAYRPALSSPSEVLRNGLNRAYCSVSARLKCQF